MGGKAMTGEKITDREEWHLDKKVPIALIFAILVQTGTAFWFASAIDTRVAQLERQGAVQEARSLRLDDERLKTARLEAQVISLIEVQRSTNAKLDNLITQLTRDPR